MLNNYMINNEPNVSKLVNFIYDNCNDLPSIKSLLDEIETFKFINNKIKKITLGTILMCTSHISESNKEEINWESYYKILNDIKI